MRVHLMFCRSLAALVLALCSTGARAQELEVHVINIGQGLSVYVETPDGTRLLVDGGEIGAGSAIVRPYLQSIGVSGLDYSLMTHWHTDHFGGLTDLFLSGYKPLIAGYDRGNVNIPSNSFVTQYLQAIVGKRAFLSVGQVLDLGGGVTLEVVTLNGAWVGGSIDPTQSAQEENTRSFSVVLRYGDFDMYIGGDVTAGGNGTSNVEGPGSANAGQVEVAIAAHHGSNTSSSTTVVNNLDPSVVLQSAGHDNPFGHPTKTVTNRWNTLGSSRMQWCITAGDTDNGAGGFTAVDDHIVLTSDGTAFTLRAAGDATTFDLATFENPGPAVAPGQVAIGEVLVDPAGTSDIFGEWFELINRHTGAVDLGGMTVQSGATQFTVASQLLLGPGERVVYGVDGRRSRNGNLLVAHGAPWQNFSLINGNSSLVLRAPNNATVDSLVWGSGGVDVTPGASAERILTSGPSNASNFATAFTAWAGGDLGTPGEVNGNDPEACPDPIVFGTGKMTSIGTTPVAGWTGTPSIYTDDFHVLFSDGIPNKPGVGLWSTTSANIPFFNGTLYVGPPISRLTPQIFDPAGVVDYDIPIDATMLGETRFYQFWFRDLQNPDGTGVGLSNALEVSFCPGEPPPPPPGAEVIVTEFMRNPTFVPDADGEYVELYNTTTFAIDIEGWTIADDDVDEHVIDNGGNGVFIQPESYLVLGINANMGQNGGIPVAYEYSGFFLGNSGDEIVLRDGADQEVDRLEYTAGAPWPSDPGRSANLAAGILDGGLNDDPANWCSSTTIIGGGNPDRGTPALANDSCP